MTALEGARANDVTLDALGVAPAGHSGIHVTPSRATWTSAQASGLASLLPADESKLYARVDFNAIQESEAENRMYERLKSLLSECARAHYNYASPAVSHLTAAHRDDLLFELEQVHEAEVGMLQRLNLLEGADQALIAGVDTLDGMYPYQEAAMARVPLDRWMGTFFGPQSNAIVKPTPSQSEPSLSTPR